MPFATEQEQFWAGEFGDTYIDRNPTASNLAAKKAMFKRMLQGIPNPVSIIEFGANIGGNIKALRELVPAAYLEAVEINSKAYEQLASIDGVVAHHTTILGFQSPRQFDLSFTVGVLIHIAPEKLRDAYAALHGASRRYILIGEYYNPEPVEVPYRGHDERLFKRDWASELMSLYPLRLLDYGFFYRGDPNHRFNDITWFLLERR
ncbi:MAG TPA: pseudaminic acid biosynthesis-associated methylase [Pseudolabrys sp.]|jgi:spore coat polysaccharide biosynthesis protein SpsF|nr:pseudaminic acid biosynthesis-associated methylase [Pseudolabrys sp.]